MSEETLFEITRNEYVIYEPKWAISFFYNGDTTEFAWCHVYGAKEDNPYSDYHPRVRVNGEEVDIYKNLHALKIAQTLRAPEVRKELQDALSEEGSIIRDFYRDSDIADAAEILYERAQTGEFLGQLNGRMIYVQEVAEILDCAVGTVLGAVSNVLIPEKRLGLNGMILTTWESQEKTKAFLEWHFGHKDMDRGDFGWWSCAHCGKSGDDYSDPSAEKCERPAKAS